MTSPLKSLWQACNPNEVLQPADTRLVDCDAARHGGVSAQLAKDFLSADPKHPLYRLFTGHIGVGKSTELLHLKNALEHPAGSAAPFIVIYFDINDHLDPNNLKLADLLILIAGQVYASLKDANIPGFSANNTALQRFWDHFIQFANSKVSVKDLELGTDFAKVTLELKAGDPVRRELLREAINAQRTTLRAAVQDLLQTATKALVKDGKSSGIIIIIDGLEKLPADQSGDLFMGGCEQLTGLDAHTLYTVPMALAYDTRFATLTQAFGHTPVPLPMLHTDTPEGLACLTKLVERRCDFAGVPFDSVFDSEETLHHLCQQTGGHMRHLLMFLQQAISRVETLPITRAAVDAAIKDYRHGLARQVPGAFWPWLRRFRSGALPSLPDDFPEDVRRDCLHQLLVFEYTNGEPRYDVNPVLRDLANFKNGDPAPTGSQS